MGLGLGLAIAAAGIVLGIAIGATGIGGVLLVPILTLALGLDVKRAIDAALLSYLPGEDLDDLGRLVNRIQDRLSPQSATMEAGDQEA